MLSVDDINRLEKENETLKDALYNKSEIEESLASAFNELTEVKSILKELKESYEKLATEHELLIHNHEMLSKEYNEQNKALCETTVQNIEYNSALEEIREKIKSLNKDICNNCGWYNTDNCQPNGYVCHDLIEIKNKINEVLKCKN